MKTILIYLFTFFVVSFVSFSQILEVKTVTEALNYTGNRASVKKLIITDSIKGTDYSEGSEWREFRTLDTTFPNIEAVEILTDQGIPNGHTVTEEYGLGLFVITYAGWIQSDTETSYPSLWLKHFSAPNVKYIGVAAFYMCKNLLSINFSNVETIAPAVFCWCESLTEINFPNLENIGNTSFGDAGLKIATFPKLKWTDWGVFIGCENLDSVSFGIDFEEQTEINFGHSVFGDSVNITEGLYDNPVATDKIKLTLGANVLPVPNTFLNTWQKTNNYVNNYDYIWKSISIYSGIKEQTNEKNIYNLGNNKYKLENIEKAELYDLVGRKIMNIENQELLDLNHLTSGFYFLKYFDKNKILRIEKIIINRNF